MNKSPIGIFDSGIGGVTIFNSIKKLLPKENIIYLSDNLHSPYGNKSIETIKKLSQKNTEWLIEKGCKLIVVACNTATTNSVFELRSNFNLPFVGIEPAIKSAAMKTVTGKVGVLATRGTLSSNLFNSTSTYHASNIEIIEENGDGLVELIEAGIFEGVEIENILHKHLDFMINKKIDYLVLGCTHYPLINKVLLKILPKSVKIIDSAEAVAKQTKALLINHKIENKSNQGEYSFYYNGDSASLNKVLNHKFEINKI
ncbi:MAG: glutamate racemase [Flavobacteriales bacterium]|jgi:glutamate racemase|tara:strand:- start:3269 stop:4039 length:771 start_codon:yes stop_codon:yes gene_type:complete